MSFSGVLHATGMVMCCVASWTPLELVVASSSIDTGRCHSEKLCRLLATVTAPLSLSLSLSLCHCQRQKTVQLMSTFDGMAWRLGVEWKLRMACPVGLISRSKLCRRLTFEGPEQNSCVRNL